MFGILNFFTSLANLEEVMVKGLLLFPPHLVVDGTFTHHSVIPYRPTKHSLFTSRGDFTLALLVFDLDPRKLQRCDIVGELRLLKEFRKCWRV